MNNEIKEILDMLKQHISIVSIEDEDLLLDYITNLQQQLHQASLDIQELTERDIECPSWCDKLTYLQQEIKHISKVRDEIIEKYNDLQQENHELKSKLECYENGVYYSSKVDELTEENKRLKENAIHNDKVVDKAKWNEMIYKSRCEKASKVIKNKYPVLCESEGDFKEELLNILEGENNGN